MRKVEFFLAAITAAVVFFGGKVAYASPKVTIRVGERVYCFEGNELKSFGGELTLKGEKKIIKGIAEDVYTEPVDAEVGFFPFEKEKFVFKEEKKGKMLNEKKLREDLEVVLSVGGGHVECEVITLEPKYTLKEAKKEVNLRGSYTTYFSYSSLERKNNVKLSALALMGKVIYSGEEFSFNSIVGERSEERGYKKAKVIIDKKATEGVGGGVCQTSTTLYNAALYAGLKISERHPHSLSPRYVPDSFDAAVSYGLFDLRILNCTDGRIYVGGRVDDNSVTIELYGLKNEYTYSFDTEFIEEITGVDETGKKRIVKYVTEGFKTVYKNGVIIGRYGLGRDEYSVGDE